MSAIDMFWAAPPISRTLTAALLSISILVYSKLLPGFWVIFYTPKIFTTLPQIWRFATCFLLSSPSFGILLDPYFMYTYGSRLEVGSPRFTQPGDFFTYVIFICSVIIPINYFWTGAAVFTSALNLAFVYTCCQDDRGGQFNLMFFNIPAQWAPIAMIFITFITNDNGLYYAKIQLTGLIAAHLYDFLTRIYPEFGGGWNPIKTPGFVRRLFAPEQVGVANRSYGTAFTPASRPVAGTGGGASTGAAAAGPLPESWRSRGSGHRLGGD